jgi:hypothetical protein
MKQTMAVIQARIVELGQLVPVIGTVVFGTVQGEQDGFAPIVRSQLDACLVYEHLHLIDRYAETLGNLAVA